MTKSTSIAVVTLLLAGSIAPPAWSQDDPPPLEVLDDASESWQIRLTPFAWLAAADGKVAARGLEAEFDSSFSDILSNIDFAIMGRVEAQHGPWHLYLAGVYMEGSDGRGVDGPLPEFVDLSFLVPPPLPGDILSEVRLPQLDSIDVDLDLGIVELGGGYRLAELETEHGSDLTLDVLAGARYFTLGTDVTLGITPGPLNLLPTRVERSQSKDWIDPTIGAKLVVPLSEDLQLGLRGDIGGFGAGSDLTWNVVGGFEHDIAPGTSLVVGYRILDIDYERGSGSDKIVFDTQFRGPIIGFTFRF